MYLICSLVAIFCVYPALGGSSNSYESSKSYGVEFKIPGKIVTVAPTPFDCEEKLNLTVVKELANYYAKNGLKNILIMEYDGGGAILRINERKALLDEWVKHGRPLGLYIMAEVGLQPFIDTLELASYCNKLKIAAITHFPEQIYKGQNIREVLYEKQAIAKVAPDIALFYNELLSTDPKIGTDKVYIEGDEVSTFCGVETTINTYNNIQAAIVDPSYNDTANCKKEVMIYDIQHMYTAFLLGLKSVTLAPNLSPSICIKMEAAADCCDRKKAKYYQNKMNSWVAAATNINNTPIIINTYSRTYFTYLKALFQIISGIDVGARVPFVRANSNEYEQITSNLRKVGPLTAD